MSKLAEICAVKLEHIKERKKFLSEKSLLELSARQSKPRGFAASLQQKAASGNVAIIAEIKKASPSKGLIREDFDVASISSIYENNGAACISVLTDKPYFQGDDSYLALARKTVTLPVLRKDFMLEPYQITESRALGADCVLLIMAALGDDQASELESAAMELGMDVLIEVHDDVELDRALKLKSPLIGVNNRSLKTLEVSLNIGENMASAIPADRIRICESGIASADDIKRMQRVGYNSFLVGESLMRHRNIAEALSLLLGS